MRLLSTCFHGLVAIFDTSTLVHARKAAYELLLISGGIDPQLLVAHLAKPSGDHFNDCEAAKQDDAGDEGG